MPTDVWDDWYEDDDYEDTSPDWLDFFDYEIYGGGEPEVPEITVTRPIGGRTATYQEYSPYYPPDASAVQPWETATPMAVGPSGVPEPDTRFWWDIVSILQRAAAERSPVLQAMATSYDPYAADERYAPYGQYVPPVGGVPSTPEGVAYAGRDVDASAVQPWETATPEDYLPVDPYEWWVNTVYGNEPWHYWGRPDFPWPGPTVPPAAGEYGPTAEEVARARAPAPPAGVPRGGVGGGGAGRGGGGAGGGGAGGGVEVELPEPLGELAWWPVAGVNPFLRPWASWMRELYQVNRMAGLPFPFDLPEPSGEGLPGVEVPDVLPEPSGIETPPGAQRTSEILAELRTRMGLEFAPEATATDKWQTLVSALPGVSSIDVRTNQLLSMMRYDVREGWYTVDIPMIQHAEYL